VCAWPGLVGSLLSGVTAAKIIAARKRLPLYAVDHVQAHLAAIHLGRGADEVPYPLVGLVASGGHSHLYLCHAPDRSEALGGTIDDAAGEAFDKVAAVLGLGYPGGPAVERAALGGDPKALALPRARAGAADALDLSFAGLKTAVLYHARGPLGRDALRLDARGIADTCASFQAAVAAALAGRLAEAGRRHGARALAAGGGVVCNATVRAALAEAAGELGVPLLLPEPRHCGDNAAMIAALGGLSGGAGVALDFSPRPGRH
jgi:N6-L-threonylcarbamoyladenine synthase